MLNHMILPENMQKSPFSVFGNNGYILAYEFTKVKKGCVVLKYNLQSVSSRFLYTMHKNFHMFYIICFSPTYDCFQCVEKPHISCFQYDTVSICQICMTGIRFMREYSFKYGYKTAASPEWAGRITYSALYPDMIIISLIRQTLCLLISLFSADC